MSWGPKSAAMKPPNGNVVAAGVVASSSRSGVIVQWSSLAMTRRSTSWENRSLELVTRIPLWFWKQCERFHERPYRDSRDRLIGRPERSSTAHRNVRRRDPLPWEPLADRLRQRYAAIPVEVTGSEPRPFSEDPVVCPAKAHSIGRTFS